MSKCKELDSVSPSGEAVAAGLSSRSASYWNPDCCPDCGSSAVDLFTYKENEQEYVRGVCRDCGNEWQSIRNDWGC